MRFAGTAKQYSMKAIPQLARITISSGAVLNLRCPYQANVMKTLDAISSRIGATEGEKIMDVLKTDWVRTVACPRASGASRLHRGGEAPNSIAASSSPKARRNAALSRV